MSSNPDFEEPIDISSTNNNDNNKSSNKESTSQIESKEEIEIPLRESALKENSTSARVSEVYRYTVLEKPLDRNTTNDLELHKHQQEHTQSQIESKVQSTVDIKQKETTNNKLPLRRFRFKIILLGEAAVGKTSFMNRYISNTFTKKYSITIAAETKKKRIQYDENTKVELTIWDTAGEERFRAMTKSFFSGAQGAIIVFDLTKVESFNKLQLWIDMINDYAPQNIMINLVGNKSDKHEERTVSTDSAMKFAQEHDINYFETSACDGTNVSMVFENLTEKMVNANQGEQKNECFEDEESHKLSKYNLNTKDDNSKRKCCGK